MSQDRAEHELVRRRDAAQATRDAWFGRPWRLGSNDCVRLFADHARRLGHPVRLPPANSYRTVNGACTKLAELGHASLPAAIDALGLARKRPACAIVGDVLQLPGVSDALPSLAIALGNGNALAWIEDVRGAAIIRPSGFVAAWDLTPR